MWRVLVMLVLFCPSAAMAGPWLRERGTFFFSAEIGVEEEGQTGAFYAEYGVRPKLTFGAHAWVDIDGLQEQRYRGAGRVFVRFPLSQPDRVHKLAMDLSLGAEVDDLDITPLYRAGLSWGRGLPKGWASVDASVEWLGGDTTTRIEGTYGRNLGQRWKAIGQLRLEQTQTFEPELEAALVWQARPNIAIKAGVAQRFGDNPGTKLVIGTWITGQAKSNGLFRQR